MNRRPLRHRGFTLSEILAIAALVGGIFLFAAIYVTRQNGRASRIKCVSQLKFIGLAYRIFSTDNNDKLPFQLSITNGGTMELTNDVVRQFFCLSNELSSPRNLICVSRSFGRTPGEKWYHREAKDWSSLATTNIDYLINLDAIEETGSFLASDNHLRVNDKARRGLFLVSENDRLSHPTNLHGSGASPSILFGDGSVQQLGGAIWPVGIAPSGSSTNRLLSP